MKRFILCLLTLVFLLTNSIGVSAAEEAKETQAESDKTQADFSSYPSSMTKIRLKQTPMGYGSGCTGMSMVLFTQNLMYNITNKEWGNLFTNSADGLMATDNTASTIGGSSYQQVIQEMSAAGCFDAKGWWSSGSNISSFVNYLNTITSNTYQFVIPSDYADINFDLSTDPVGSTAQEHNTLISKNSNGGNIVTGWTDREGKAHDFSTDLNRYTAIEILKNLHNAGYFMLVGVGYAEGGSTLEKSSDWSHMTMFAGITSDGILVNDPATGLMETIGQDNDTTSSTTKHYYKITCIIPFKADAEDESSMPIMSPAKIGGGTIHYTLEDEKQKQQELADTNSSGGSSSNSSSSGSDLSFSAGNNKTRNEDNLGEYSRLSEEELYLGDGSDLSIEERSNLQDWNDITEAKATEYKILHILRVGVQVIGILFLSWIILLYIAYWVDRTNTICDFHLVYLLSLGKLETSHDDTQSQFSLSSSKARNKNGEKNGVLVNHKDMLTICLIGIFLSVILISGSIYTILVFIIKTAQNIISHF